MRFWHLLTEKKNVLDAAYAQLAKFRCVSVFDIRTESQRCYRYDVDLFLQTRRNYFCNSLACGDVIEGVRFFCQYGKMLAMSSETLNLEELVQNLTWNLYSKKC